MLHSKFRLCYFIVVYFGAGLEAAAADSWGRPGADSKLATTAYRWVCD